MLNKKFNLSIKLFFFVLLYGIDGDFMEKAKEDLLKKKTKKMKEKQNSEKKDKKVEKKLNNKKEKVIKSKRLKKKKDSKGKKSFGKIFSHRFNLDLLDVMILIIVVAIFSCFLTGFIVNRQYKELANDYKNFLKDEEANRFINTYNEIVNNYYEEIDRKEMVNAAIDGMMNFLKEKYSIYLDKNETSNLSDSLEGSYEGIGILAEGPTIVQVYEDSPAYKAGMKANDVIKEVNGIAITIENYQDISNIIKNNDDNLNKIVVLRDEKELIFEVKTDKVILPVVSSEVLEVEDKKIGYLVFTSFSSSSFEQFQDELLKVEKDMDSLIIDLRGNTGGYLESAFDISSLFIEKGKVIYSLENKGETKKFKDKDNQHREYPIVVLVDYGTASASEILALALKESYGATIVGKTTYGKGKVQSMIQYDDTMVKYTSAKWLGPNGNCIDGVGIVPDYEVSLEISDNIIYDKQLDKAIEILKK